MAKPFIKFVGGKTKLIPDLLDLVPQTFGDYHEPFVGGGALFFALEEAGRFDGSNAAYLSDAEPRLIKTWRMVRNHPYALLEKLARMPNEKAFFMSVRKGPDPMATQMEIAAWRIYVAKTAFNGIYRVNGIGEYNVPFGGYKNPKIADEATIRACSKALRRANAQIECGDFADRISRAKRNDLVYADPPYIPLSKTSNFTSYTVDKFDDADHIRLRDVLAQAKQRGVSIIASNADVKRTRALYTRAYGFRVISLKTRRNVAADGDKRTDVDEVIII